MKKASRLGRGSRTTRISIGMCAWNEEHRIVPTLRSLCQQDVIRRKCGGIESVEILVLVNASTDRTAEVARETLEEELAALGDPEHVRVKIVETPEGGLARSINKITHDLSDPEADYLVKMDCDVEIIEPDVIGKLVARLENDSEVVIARPQCLKHIVAKDKQSLSDRISLLATRVQNEGKSHVPLAGALYCGRADTLRTIWEPIGLRGTDVYVRDMVVTENWRYPKDRRDHRVVLVADATVLFDAYVGVRHILYHRSRAEICQISRLILHNFFNEQVGEEDAGQLVHRLNREDPDWYQKLIHSRLRHGRWWVLPCPMFRWARVRSLRRASLLRRAVLFPLMLALELVDAYATVCANRIFKKKAEMTVWRPGETART